MPPQEILKKDSFRRAKPLPYDNNAKGGSSDYDSNAAYAPMVYSYPTQDDFLREYDPHSHAINSLKYYPNLLYMDKEQSGKYKAIARSRVSVAWQKRIHTKRLIALTGYDPDITTAKSKSDSASQDNLALFKEGWSIKNMDTAIHAAISSDLKVGDTAICGYKSKGKFGHRIFAYDKGDTLYPHFDPISGELVLFGRKFSADMMGENGATQRIDYLDVWDENGYMQYRQSMAEERKEGSGEWIVSVPYIPHGFPFCPVAYHRYGEPCWAGSQSLIEQDELALSQLAENNAQYALRILYTLGAEFEMEGSTDGTPRLISGTDAQSKVGFLEPADSSSSFKLQLDTLEKEIMRCSFAVESPEIKSGSDISSLTVKALMADSYLKAVEDAKEYHPFLSRVVDIFIEGYGTECEKRAEFMNLHIQIGLQPWVFLSETEVVNTVVQLVSVGVLSKQSATEYIYETLGLGTVDEAKRLLQEAHDELVAEQTPAVQPSNVIAQARNNG